jgi:hypothetical protein
MSLFFFLQVSVLSGAPSVLLFVSIDGVAWPAYSIRRKK